jgi:hypothetical protein
MRSGGPFFFARTEPFLWKVRMSDTTFTPLNPDDFLNTDEAAVILRRQTKTLEQWRWKRIGPPFIRQGPRSVMYRRGDLVDWMKAQTVRHTDKFAA